MKMLSSVRDPGLLTRMLRPRSTARPELSLRLDDLKRRPLALFRQLKGAGASRFIHVTTPRRAFPAVPVLCHGDVETISTPEMPSLPLAEPCRALRASTYRTPQRFTMVLPGVLYEPTQNVLTTERFEPIEQEDQVPRRLHQFRWRPYLIDRRRIERLPGTYTSLRSFRDNYFHTLCDNVPSLDNLREPPYRDVERIHLIHAPPLTPAEAFFLERMAPENVVPFPVAPGRFYQLERYVFSSFSSRRYSGCLPTTTVSELRRRSAPERPASRRRRIFISRALARRGRHVVNEAEVMDLLRPLGFERVLLERLSAEEQVELFHDAVAVVAPHGAGLANLLFAERADVVELFPQSCVWPHFYLLGKSGRHRYHFVCGDRPDREDRFRVDVAKLEHVVERISSGDAAAGSP